MKSDKEMLNRRIFKILIATLFGSLALGLLTRNLLIIFIFVLIVLFLGFLWLVNKKISKKNQSLFQIFPTRANNYKDFRRNFDMVNVGGTEALFALDYTYNDRITGLNWANEHQTLEYDFLILKNFFGIIKKHGKVLLFLTPHTYLGNTKTLPNEYQYQIFLDRFLIYTSQKKRFFFRDWILTHTIDVRKQNKVHLMAITRYPILYPFTVYKLLKTRKKRDLDFKKQSHQPYNKNKQITTINNKSKKAIEKNKKIYIDIINFLKERELHPVIILPPVLHFDLYTSSISNAIEKELNHFIKIAEDYNIPILNFMKSSEFSEEMFIDSYRLNEDGRKKFTNKLITELNNIKY